VSLRAAVIAAGEGSRLAASHPGCPKPLVPVGGRPLIHWVAAGLAEAGARELVVLTNGRGGAIPPSLSAAFPDLEFDFVRADTASSFESFRLVSLRLAARGGEFLVSTADALMPAADVRRFLDACRASGAEAGLALTAHVDDEKPLWADLDAAGRVTAAGDDARERRRVTCGLYYMTPAAAARLPEAAAHGRLRDFWRALVASGARVAGVELSKSLDVDRPEDVAAADAYLTTERTR
jgi:NDP-sugar pyrophosphorylase family protein